jgi:tripartite-type tricarboxylate transporter receptor subunit TctC
MKESGVNVVYDQWRGFAAPKGTPLAVIEKMSALIKKAVESKEWVDFTASVGSAPLYRDPVSFAKFVAEMDKVTKEIAESAGLTQ